MKKKEKQEVYVNTLVDVETLEKLIPALQAMKIKLEMIRWHRKAEPMEESKSSSGVIVEDTIYERMSVNEYDKFIEADDCNTACCVGGLIPSVSKKYRAKEFLQTKVVNGEEAKGFSFVKITTTVAGFDDSIKEFVFGAGIKDDVKDVIMRLKYVIKHRSAPKAFLITGVLGRLYNYNIKQSEYSNP